MEDYPETDIDPRVRNTIDRCSELGESLEKDNGERYSYRTLSSKCLHRMIDDTEPRKVDKDSFIVTKGRKVPESSARDHEYGHREIGLDGREYIINKNKKGQNYWKVTNRIMGGKKLQSLDNPEVYPIGYIKNVYGVDFKVKLDDRNDKVWVRIRNLLDMDGPELDKYGQVIEQEQQQQEGGFISSALPKLPILDNPMLTEFLKLNAISNLNGSTLIPVGILVALQEIYSRSIANPKIFKNKRPSDLMPFSTISN